MCFYSCHFLFENKIHQDSFYSLPFLLGVLIRHVMYVLIISRINLSLHSIQKTIKSTKLSTRRSKIMKVDILILLLAGLSASGKQLYLRSGVLMTLNMKSYFMCIYLICISAPHNYRTRIHSPWSRRDYACSESWKAVFLYYHLYCAFSAVCSCGFMSLIYLPLIQ